VHLYISILNWIELMELLFTQVSSSVMDWDVSIKTALLLWFLQEIEPSIGQALCSLWDKIPPFVPKSTFFGSLKTSQDLHETTAPSKNAGYYGRPIRGNSYLGYGPGYQHFNMNYGHRGQHPKWTAKYNPVYWWRMVMFLILSKLFTLPSMD
jgi:hypothetical protein